ncbi:MAG: hypothetical protein OHK0037_11280 [Elainellaceae cyanobacterium]
MGWAGQTGRWMWRGDRPLLLPAEPGAIAGPDEPKMPQRPTRRIVKPHPQLTLAWLSAHLLAHLLIWLIHPLDHPLVWRSSQPLQTLIAATISLPS